MFVRSVVRFFGSFFYWFLLRKVAAFLVMLLAVAFFALFG